MRSGFRIFAVSAMKWTPAKRMTSASVFFAGGLRELERVSEVVREVLDVAVLVVVGEQDGVPLLLEVDDGLVEVGRQLRHAAKVGLAPPDSSAEGRPFKSTHLW
jgi:hypothetical protein